MSRFDVSRQEQFYSDLLLQLDDQPTSEIIALPGAVGDQDGVNTLRLGMVPLSGFGQLPYADDFERRFGRAPHLIAFLGRRTVLAMVEMHGLESTGNGRRGQRLINYMHTGPEQITAIPPGDTRSINLDRGYLAGNTGFKDPAVNRNIHAMLVNNGAHWTVYDMGSTNGTILATEADTTDLGYGSYMDDDTEIIVDTGQIERINEMPPSVHTSMKIRARTRHNLPHESDD